MKLSKKSYFAIYKKKLIKVWAIWQIEFSILNILSNSEFSVMEKKHPVATTGVKTGVHEEFHQQLMTFTKKI